VYGRLVTSSAATVTATTTATTASATAATTAAKTTTEQLTINRSGRCRVNLGLLIGCNRRHNRFYCHGIAHHSDVSLDCGHGFDFGTDARFSRVRSQGGINRILLGCGKFGGQCSQICRTLNGRANLGVLILRQHATTPTAAATAATATATTAAGLRHGLKCGRAEQACGHRHYQKSSLFHAIL